MGHMIARPTQKTVVHSPFSVKVREKVVGRWCTAAWSVKHSRLSLWCAFGMTIYIGVYG